MLAGSTSAELKILHIAAFDGKFHTNIRPRVLGIWIKRCFDESEFSIKGDRRFEFPVRLEEHRPCSRRCGIFDRSLHQKIRDAASTEFRRDGHLRKFEYLAARRDHRYGSDRIAVSNSHKYLAATLDDIFLRMVEYLAVVPLDDEILLDPFVIQSSKIGSELRLEFNDLDRLIHLPHGETASVLAPRFHHRVIQDDRLIAFRTCRDQPDLDADKVREELDITTSILGKIVDLRNAQSIGSPAR